MSKRYQGSILVAVLLFFYLFTQFLFLMLTDYRLTHSYSESTQDFYTAKIIRAMFLSEVENVLELEAEGKREYSAGNLVFIREDRQIKMVITVSGKSYDFEETVLTQKLE